MKLLTHSFSLNASETVSVLLANTEFLEVHTGWPGLEWLGGVVVSMSDSRSRGPGFDSRPVNRQATTMGKLLTPMCLCHQAVQFGTGQRAVMLCSPEGRRTGHASQTSGLSTYGLTAKVREMSTLRPFGHGPLYLYLFHLIFHTSDTTHTHLVVYW